MGQCITHRVDLRRPFPTCGLPNRARASVVSSGPIIIEVPRVVRMQGTQGANKEDYTAESSVVVVKTLFYGTEEGGTVEQACPRV